MSVLFLADKLVSGIALVWLLASMIWDFARPRPAVTRTWRIGPASARSTYTPPHTRPLAIALILACVLASSTNEHYGLRWWGVLGTWLILLAAIWLQRHPKAAHEPSYAERAGTDV